MKQKFTIETKEEINSSELFGCLEDTLGRKEIMRVTKELINVSNDIKIYVVRDMIHLLSDSSFYYFKTKEEAMAKFNSLYDEYKTEIEEFRTEEELDKYDFQKDDYIEVYWDDGTYYNNLQFEEVTLK